MTLKDVFLYLFSILPARIKDAIQTLQRAPVRPLNAPEPSHTGSQKDAFVQTDLDQVETGSLQAARDEMKRLRKKAQRAKQRARLVQTQLETAHRRLEKAGEDRIAFDQRAQQTETRLHEATHRTKHLETAIGQLSRELQESKSELEKTSALLDTRSAELRDAEAYLNKLDDVADTEVLRLVDEINSRIFQASSNIADTFQSRYGEQKDVQVLEVAAARVRGLLNDNILLALSSIHHADDPLVVQIVLQAAMVSYAARLCSTWDFRVADSPCLLQDMYQSIRRTGTYPVEIWSRFLIDEKPEPQSIAGRWRALSRTYVKTPLVDDTDRQRIAVQELLDRIIDILLASGIETPQHDLREEVELSYADTLRQVIRQSLEFQRITGERIISRDLFIITVAPEDPFDPSRMVDVWDKSKRARHPIDPHPVLCTTQLGLVREEKKAAEGAGDKEAVAAVVLLKPKVVLTSLLKELWNEQVCGTCKT